MPRTSALQALFDRAQFSVPEPEKQRLLLSELQRLTELHRARCHPYQRICDDLIEVPRSPKSASEVPFLPVSLFKTHDLKSVDDTEVFKVMTSSGTSGQSVSRIYLDRYTADLQTSALTQIMKTVLGGRRLPMIVVDSPNVIKDRKTFSARGAGLLGMSPFGRRHFYALSDDMELNVDGLQAFAKEHGGGPVLVFGFTFMVWKYFIEALRELKVKVDLPQAIIVHSGGWKKLQEEAVSNADFKRVAREIIGTRRVHNYYGMVEQTGSIFMEAPDGYLRPSNFSDVLIRDPNTWLESPVGVPGVVEVLSVLPHSYPGHALLTEDWGVVHGLDDGASGWAGKRLEILGRVPRSELRGCSDTHAYDAAAV